MTLATCSIKKHFTTSLTAGVRDQDQSSQVRQTSITHLLPFDWLWYKTFTFNFLYAQINWSRARPRSVYQHIHEIKSILNISYFTVFGTVGVSFLRRPRQSSNSQRSNPIVPDSKVTYLTNDRSWYNELFCSNNPPFTKLFHIKEIILRKVWLDISNVLISNSRSFIIFN